MTAYLLVCSASFLASGLTLFSGFGLGTLLLPAFALFFPLPISVGLTAVVHFLNNLFKLALLGRHADRRVVLHFGAPAVLAAFAGASCLAWLSSLAPLGSYEAFGRELLVRPVNLSIGLLMAVFAFLEILPAFAKLSFDRRHLPWGGLLSGFFGGLSGHQGALRSAFLVRCGLSKESFVASGVVIACLVDLARLGTYAARFSAGELRANASLLSAAVLSAFLGAWLGNRLLPKIAYRSIQRTVAAMLLLIAAGLCSGVL